MITRRMLNLLTGLSLLLCVAVCVLWVRSYRVDDQFICTTGARLWWAMCMEGHLKVASVGDWPGPERPRWIADPSDRRVPVATFTVPWSERRWLGVTIEQGIVRTSLDEEGRPVPLGQQLTNRKSRAGPLLISPTMVERGVIIPFWMVAPVTGVLPLTLVARVVGRYLARRRHLAAGFCTYCGYDFCATPGRCPECGRVATGGVA